MARGQRAGKRGAGEGTVFQRKDGLWAARLSFGSCEITGTRLQMTVYAGTQAEVLLKLEELRQKKKHGAKAALSKDSLGAFLKRWLADDIELNKAAKTHQEYEIAVRLYIQDFIGSVRLNSLDGEALLKWQAELKRAGHSANTRLRSIRVLRNALNKAVKLRLIPFNPVMALDKPKVIRKEVRPLEPEQIHRLIEVCKVHRLGDLIILGAMTGLRKGELFGLEWSAVNLMEGVLVVRRTLEELKGVRLKEPKTDAGRRVVTLGAEAVAALQRRYTKAVDENLHPDSAPIVFPDTRGGFLRSSNFDRQVWYPLRKAAGIPESFVFHDLRHTQASLMLAAGVDLKVIQVRLGHRDFATTANVYSHLLAGVQSDATVRVDELLNAAKPKVTAKGSE